MVYFIRPGDTPEYLEELRKRGFLTVSFKIDEAVEKEYANIVVSAADNDSAKNNYLEGPTYTVYPSYEDITLKPFTLVPDEDVDDPSKTVYKLVPVDADNDDNMLKDTTGTDTTVTKNIDWEGPNYPVNWPDSTDTTPQEYKLVLVEGEPGEPLKLVPVVDETDTTVDPGSLDGPNPIGGGHHQYHFVQYGETQEYLESLQKEGYILAYRNDNPPEEGKLTISKPNPEEFSNGTIHIAPAGSPVVFLNLVDSELWSESKLSNVASLLTLKYSKFSLDFVTERPAEGDYYTLCIGSAQALQDYATSQGLVYDSENPNASPGIGFAVVEKKEHSAISPTLIDMIDEVAVETDVLRSIGDQLSALLADECPGIADYSPVTPFSDTVNTTETDTTVTDPADNDTVRNIEPGLYGPGNVTVHIDPEYAKQMEEQFNNVKMRVGGYGRGQAFFRFIYDSEEAETPSGYELVRTEMWSGPDCTDEQIADIARYIISNDISDEQQKALMLEAVDAFLAKEEKITVADGTPNYTPVVNYSIVSPDEKEAKAEDTTTETEQEGTPATPRIRVTITNNYARDPSSPFYDAYVMLKNSGALILPMDGKVTVWPSDVIEYLNKNYPDWDTDSYTEEEIAALQDAYSHLLKGDYLMQDSDNNTLTDTTKTDTTVNDTTDRTITLPGGLIVKLSDVLLVTDSLPDDTNTYFYRVSDYINPETGRLEDIPIPLYVCKNSEQVAFISTVDAETEAMKSVQVACADTDGWRTVGTLINTDGIDWKYNAGNLTGSGAPSVVWHAQELGALGVWTDGTDNWTGIAGWFDANWTMLGCGDFDGDGKDSVLMSLYGGLFYSVDLDGTLASLGDLNWSGWEFGAVGDFAGDGKADVVLYHKELGSVVLLADGNSDDWTSLGQIDGSDWAVAGAGDFNSDGIADLLVRQASTGLIGGYAGADMSRWSVVDSDAGYYLA